MVSKNSRMGNLVGIGVYHSQNLFKFTERVWREEKSWGNPNGKQVFPLGILDYPSRNPVLSRKVSFGKTKIGLPLHSNRNFQIFLVNGKQPVIHYLHNPIM